MLKIIQSTVEDYVRIVSRVTGVNAEVLDKNLVRVAASGRHVRDACADEVYRHVLRIRRSFVLENPRQHHICIRCPDRDWCETTLALCAPIVDGEDVLGVFGLSCVDKESRERLLENRESYIAFLEQCAEFIRSKIRDRQNLDRSKAFLDIMLHILDVNARGILIFNAKGGISYLNDVARRELGLENESGLPTDVVMRRTGEKFTDLEEFVMEHKGRKVALAGQLVPLGTDGKPADPHFFSVFTFESLPRIASRTSFATFGHSPEASGLDSLRGSSPPLLELKKQIQRVASSPSTVFITGESGTGKEMVARAIHACGDRADKPFIGVNCGAIPDSLLESELFGYAGGAFTGASNKGRIGKFELAHKGVIFLDEITTMPLYLQVKLLRALQERAFARLGSNRLIEVDIRVIAAANEDPARCVAEGRFRDDLYYRLNVIPLYLPPLRQRAGDVTLLAEFFLSKYCTLFGKPVPAMLPELRAALETYSWPGNVREFENTMEFMVNMMPDGGKLGPELLPAHIRKALAAPAMAALHLPDVNPNMAPDILPLAELERRAIDQALARFGTDTNGKRAAAAALGIGVATLYRKLKE